jgi:curved DNA-binding protein CbpA
VRDLYRILGIPDNATMADVKSAYRRLAKLYHPDLNPGSRHSEERFKEILDAYTVLSDEELRAQYDRKRMFGSSPTGAYSAPPHQPNEKKREPNRKEYPPEYIELMRQRNRTRVVKQIKRRKRILRGMIITFALYLVATAVFESWMDSQREKQTQMIAQTNQEKQTRDSLINVTDVIRNLDSPYDSIFGPAQSTWLSPNQVVVVNPHTDAVICLVHNASGKTIRNEFIHARQSFVMKDVPNGDYSVKVYTGVNWNTMKPVPDGRALGGFSTNERYFSIQRKPISLLKPTYNNPNTVTTDTVRIDTSSAKIVEISREDFFR